MTKAIKTQSTQSTQSTKTPIQTQLHTEEAWWKLIEVQWGNILSLFHLSDQGQSTFKFNADERMFAATPDIDDPESQKKKEHSITYSQFLSAQVHTKNNELLRQNLQMLEDVNKTNSSAKQWHGWQALNDLLAQYENIFEGDEELDEEDEGEEEES